jgi:hypothetical protein
MSDPSDIPPAPAPEAPAAPEAPPAPAAQNVEPVRVEDEMHQSFLDYSMSVIVGRALPDARDGMKPVHRRCIYAMGEMGNTHGQAHKKSARVVGEVVNMSADESILDNDGRIDLGRLEPIMFDSAALAYRVVGEKVGDAFQEGKKLK